MWLVVVSPHVKQIHAVRCRRSSGPTISSGTPRRLIRSSSLMSKIGELPAGSHDTSLGGSLAAPGQDRTL
jgi:hypothetical protein